VFLSLLLNVSWQWLQQWLFLSGSSPLFTNSRTELTLIWPSLSLSLSLMLRATVRRPVYLWIKKQSGAYDQIFISLWQLRSCFCGAHSLTRGGVCLLYMLLAFASVVFLWSESLRTRYNILLSQIWDSPFRRLLRFAGSRWRYSTHLHTGWPDQASNLVMLINFRHVPRRKHISFIIEVQLLHHKNILHSNGNVFTESLLRNGPSISAYLAVAA
jgi:hypothetical protein